MSSMIPDPENEGDWLIGHAAVGGFGVQTTDVVLRNVHPESACTGTFCVVHNPSPHHMRTWKLNWRDDRGLMERICPHGVGHPDPDSLAFHVRHGRTWQGIHGCCGCCTTTTDAADAT